MKNKLFRRIALIGRPGKNTANTLNAVKNYLLKKHLSVFLEEKTADMMKKNHLPIFSDKKLPEKLELIIVVGGDGSLLNAAHCALPHHIPVLGINRGHLGFLTDIRPTDLSKIGDVLSGHYEIENRFLITAKNGKRILGDALNDFVLTPGSAKLIEFEIRINHQLMCQQRADGLIVSTPTGSTAYALSGGGPILHPHLNAIVLVPMFPHTLSNRPIVVEGNAKIEIHIHGKNETSPLMSCDGQPRLSIHPGETITITQHKKKLKLIHPESYEYFATLREKLGWQR